jgi:beta-phosphoglucomutase-like phosphatase (HAD superfamily)
VSPLSSLALIALLAQPPAPAQRGDDAPPGGRPADQALWSDLRATTNAAVLHMARLAQCSYRLAYGRYYQWLDAIAGDPAAPDREEARAIRADLEAAARAAEDALPEQPGVRECRYALRDLGLVMPLAASEPRAAQSLQEARTEGERCVRRLAPLAATLLARADALEAALAKADALAARRPAPPPVPDAAPVPAPLERP